MNSITIFDGGDDHMQKLEPWKIMISKGAKYQDFL